MKQYVLNYYPFFKCVAGECRHTCCAGWEMNIDKQSLSAYQNDKTAFAGALKGGINFKKSCFKADKNGRCAFLNQKGLCEIIINLGEQSLCQVCRDHPRFRAFFDDRIETGLGFSCETATRLILSFKDKIEPSLINDDNKLEELDFSQKTVLGFRQKALEIIQDRNEEINLRINKLLSLCGACIDGNDHAKILKAFFSFERLDKSWTKRLKSLKMRGGIRETDQSLALYAEQFLVNSLYRHLYDAEDAYAVRARAIACVISWFIINDLFEQEQGTLVNKFDLIVDVVREYSAEVEYSQKNLDKLFCLGYKFIKA